MTIREELETRLIGHGLWPKEATTIIEHLENAESHKDMRHRWDDDVSSYAPQLLAVLFMGAKAEAIKWIDANKPMHFARCLLV